jgi:predicted transposase YdaD
MAALKFPKNLIQKVLEVGRMENSPLFEGIREEWEAKGKAKGKVEGKAEGKARGKAEGMAEILFDMLEAKFGKVPDGLRARLNASKNQEDIKQAMRKAVTSDTLEEYMAKLLH